MNESEVAALVEALQPLIIANHYAEKHGSVMHGGRISTCTDGECPRLWALLSDLATAAREHDERHEAALKARGWLDEAEAATAIAMNYGEGMADGAAKERERLRVAVANLRMLAAALDTNPDPNDAAAVRRVIALIETEDHCRFMVAVDPSSDAPQGNLRECGLPTAAHPVVGQGRFINHKRALLSEAPDHE